MLFFNKFVWANADLELTADIDLTGVSLGEGIRDTYRGTLDGDGYVIYGMTFDKDGTGELGIFRHLRAGTIKNLGIEGARIVGRDCVGVFAGQSHGGTIKNCWVVNSYIEGRDGVGALVGQIEGESGTGSLIQDCYAIANVKARDYQGGGLVGKSKAGAGTVQNCYFSGTVEVRDQRASGILGLQDSDEFLIVANCVNLATSMICGEKYGIASVRNGKSSLTNNYLIETLSGIATNGNADEKGTNLTVANSKAQTFYQTTLGWNFTSTWKIEEGVSYPTLQVQRVQILSLSNHTGLCLKAGTPLSLSGITRTDGAATPIVFTTEDTGITITGKNVTISGGTLTTPFEATIKATSGSAETTFTISVLPALINISSVADLNLITAYPMGDFKLTDNIDMSSATSFFGLCSESKPFTGTFDGDGHIITGLTIARSSENDNKGSNAIGLFRKMQGATIQKVGLEGVAVDGNENVGGIVGIADGGSIQQCYVTSTETNAYDRAAGIAALALGGVTIKDCYVTGTIKAREHQSGGIVAASQGAVRIENCYFEGTITGGNFKASMLGLLDSDANVTISNCLNLASQINNGTPSRIINVGGRMSFANLSNNYSISTTSLDDNTVTGTTSDVNGLNLPNDNDAKSSSFYTGLGWNFSTIWAFATSSVYPVLKAFPADFHTSATYLNETTYKVSVQNGTLTISGLSSEAVVSIFTISGQKLTSTIADTELQYQLPAKGFYLISIEENGTKSTIKAVKN